MESSKGCLTNWTLIYINRLCELVYLYSKQAIKKAKNKLNLYLLIEQHINQTFKTEMSEKKNSNLEYTLFIIKKSKWNSRNVLVCS